MQKIVSITSQGQVTIPKQMLREFNIENGAKAVIKKEGKRLVVEPKVDFWSLAGSLKSKVILSDEELRKAREEFGKTWPKK